MPSSRLEWHGHNDFHKVHANAGTAWLYGCDALNSTLFGVGERTGNPPLEGAVIRLKNLSNDRIWASGRTDKNGIFKLAGVESGIYIYGVETARGNFNSEGFVALQIRAQETAKPFPASSHRAKLV